MLGIATNSLKHLGPTFDKKLVVDIAPPDVARYQKSRLDAGASNRTVNIAQPDAAALRDAQHRDRCALRHHPPLAMAQRRFHEPLPDVWERQDARGFRPHHSTRSASARDARLFGQSFPDRQTDDYVFPHERYGASGTDEVFGFTAATVYGTDPSRPTGAIKVA